MFFLIATLLTLPPRHIPPEQIQAFTLEGQIPVSYWYFNNTYSAVQPLVYTYEAIETMKSRVLAREVNHYGSTDPFLYAALDQFPIRGKKVAIMGSIIPWYEAMVLAYGGKPTTIDYNRIVSEHPDVRTLTVEEYEKNPEMFDAVISISSYEHDGLGRYGDPIAPRGDFMAMEKTKKMLVPRGLLFLAVPIGKDHLVWNAHRVYGAIRLPLLLAGWKRIASFGFEESDLQREGSEQPVFVLQVDE
ncbi:MAG: DUF268 domain-containing protein [Chlamydiia bacterium]|nr:DUF268 domain-containing protein [Chlamydiia bacterium]